MPRSRDGRWVKQCEVCGREYHQRKPDQVACSVACRGKLFHNTGGPRAKAGLDPRKCKTCGTTFLPVRETHWHCTPLCHLKSEAVKDSRVLTNVKRRIATAPDPEARRAENFRLNLLKYGMTVAEFLTRLEAQGGVCKICGRPPKPGGIKAAARLHVDHDHETGRNRDLICLNCNQGLGCFKDDPALLRGAAEYIERHRAAVSV